MMKEGAFLLVVLMDIILANTCLAEAGKEIITETNFTLEREGDTLKVYEEVKIRTFKESHEGIPEELDDQIAWKLINGELDKHEIQDPKYWDVNFFVLPTELTIFYEETIFTYEQDKQNKWQKSTPVLKTKPGMKWEFWTLTASLVITPLLIFLVVSIQNKRNCRGREKMFLFYLSFLSFAAIVYFMSHAGSLSGISIASASAVFIPAIIITIIAFFVTTEAKKFFYEEDESETNVILCVLIMFGCVFMNISLLLVGAKGEINTLYQYLFLLTILCGFSLFVLWSTGKIRHEWRKNQELRDRLKEA